MVDWTAMNVLVNIFPYSENIYLFLLDIYLRIKCFSLRLCTLPCVCRCVWNLYFYHSCKSLDCSTFSSNALYFVVYILITIVRAVAVHCCCSFRVSDDERGWVSSHIFNCCLDICIYIFSSGFKSFLSFSIKLFCWLEIFI